MHGGARLSATGRQHLRTTLATATLGVAVVLLSACTRAPQVALAPAATSGVCREVAWPTTVGNAARVATDPVSGSVAAWGDPAIVARCGLDPLPPTTESCVTVDDIDWVVRPLSDGSAATTFGRDPAIEVLAPGAYGPAPLLLPAFSAAAAALPTNGRRCS